LSGTNVENRVENRTACDEHKDSKYPFHGF
jgi:hypothetical protein